MSHCNTCKSDMTAPRAGEVGKFRAALFEEIFFRAERFIGEKFPRKDLFFRAESFGEVFFSDFAKQFFAGLHTFT